MTMVAAGVFEDGAVLISDSRASYKHSKRLIPNDSLQKILPIGRVRVFCYSGSVSIANKAVLELQRLNHQKKDFQYLDAIIKKLPGLLKTIYKRAVTREKEGGLSVIVGGKLLSGEIKFWHMQAPNFYPHEINSHKVIGSGSVVKDYLDAEIGNIRQKTGLKAKADALILGLSGELSRHGIDSVGGLFQVVVIDDQGVRPFDHGYVDLNPEEPGSAAYMHMENGQWIQHNLTNGEKVPVLNPSTLLGQPVSERRVHDYISPSGNNQKSQWHLNYFITSRGVKIGPGDLSFINPIVSQGSHQFPFVTNFYANIGFWGTSQEEELILVWEKDGVRKEIGRIPFKIEYFPEDIDIQIAIKMEITDPGVAFLECWVKDKRLSRRVMQFVQVDSVPDKDEKIRMIQAEKVNEQMKSSLVKLVDPVIMAGEAQVVYFLLCQAYSNNTIEESFSNQFWVTYWKKYPLPLRCYIAFAFRVSPGEHKIKYDLVDAASRVSSTVFSAEIESSSSCIIKPVHCELIVKIPKPGYYFLNAHIDGKLVASTVLIAETDEPRFSYSILEDAKKQVSSGQLMCLVKRSAQKT